jgi:hypothetical protein
MSITVNTHPSDDPAFIALVNRMVAKLDGDYDPEEVFIVEIKNWFDHKWLKFSGIGRVPFDSVRDSHPQVALDEFFQEKVTFPPFTPNRILHEQWWAYDTSKRRHVVHRKKRRQHSSWNLQRRVTQFAHSALFVWYSSGTKANDRGSVMVYRVDGERVQTWYASLRKTGGWRLDRTKGIPRDSVNGLLDEIAEPSAAPNGGPATQLGNSRVTEGPPSVS